MSDYRTAIRGRAAVETGRVADSARERAGALINCGAAKSVPGEATPLRHPRDAGQAYRGRCRRGSRHGCRRAGRHGAEPGAYLAENVAGPLIHLGIFTEAEDLAPVGQWSYE
jgi:hypothetical protein